MGKTGTLQNLQKEIQRRSPEDIHNYMSWWAMFEAEKAIPPGWSAFSPPPVKTAQKAKAKKKNKRKMAKASKKKNRR